MQGTNQNVACLLLPPEKPAEIWAVWRLPEVGTTYLHADNDGTGYSVEKDGVTPINLVYEFARTEYRITFQQYQQLAGAGYKFTDDINQMFDSARQGIKPHSTCTRTGWNPPAQCRRTKC